MLSCWLWFYFNSNFQYRFTVYQPNNSNNNDDNNNNDNNNNNNNAKNYREKE